MDVAKKMIIDAPNASDTDHDKVLDWNAICRALNCLLLTNLIENLELKICVEL